MRKFTVAILLLLMTGMLLDGCKSLQPQMPAESYKYLPVKPESSVVSLFADLDILRLQSLVNNNTDSLLYNDDSFTDNDNDNLKVKAWKNGVIKFMLADDLLSWEIPLRVEIKKSALLIAFNHPFGDIIEANGEIILKFKTKISVNNDWSIKTVTTSDDYEWTKKPTVKVAGLTIPVTPIAYILLKANLNSFSRQIDQTISASFNFKKYAEMGWKIMFDPIQIPGGYHAWISMMPNSIALLPIKGSNGKIRFGAVVTSEIECMFDKQPLPGKVPPLPNLLPPEMPNDTFRVNVLTDIPYPTIERLTLLEVRDSVYSFGDKHLSFETMHVYGSNGQLTIETTVKGSVKGTIFLSGKPYFNAADTTLRIRELKFDLKTRNLWIKSAKWLFNGKMERTLTEAIAIPFNSNIREIEKNLTGYLNHRKLGYGFEINGKLNKISVSDLLLTPESVKANMLLSGKLSIGIEEKP